MQSVNFLLDSFGLGPFSIDQILLMLDQHGIPSSGKENASATQKFINKIISMGEKNGGMTLVACARVLRAVIENSTLSELEGCILRSLDFSKSVILHSSDGTAKACCKCILLTLSIALKMMKFVYSKLNCLSNQFLRDSLNRLKEFVYFHLEILKIEALVFAAFLCHH